VHAVDASWPVPVSGVSTTTTNVSGVEASRMGGLSPASEVHPVGGPNAPVSPHARGAHSEAKLPALPIQSLSQ
jgi:hypothetical protein